MATDNMLKVRCGVCKGAGGSFSTLRPCSNCQGRGFIRLFPTPLEREIAKRKAIEETCDQAGL